MSFFPNNLSFMWPKNRGFRTLNILSISCRTFRCCNTHSFLLWFIHTKSSIHPTTDKHFPKPFNTQLCLQKKTEHLPLQTSVSYTSVIWLMTVRSSPTPVSDNCVLPTLEHSLSVGHAAVLETGPLLQQDHNLDSLQPNLRLSGLSYAQFRQLLKIFLLEQLCHGAV